MKRIILVLSVLVPMIVLSCQPESGLAAKKNVTLMCVTGDADEIAINSATLKGTVLISDATEEYASAWFLIGTESSTLAKTGKKVDAGKVPAKAGSVSAVAADLEPDTKYYFMLSVSIDGKESAGEVSSFSTLARPKDKIVTAEASAITETTALLYGYVNLAEGESGEFGIIYSTNENPSKENGRVVGSTEIDRNNKFFSTITGLEPATKYYYKAYYVYDGYQRVGEVKSFTTLEVNASVSTGEASIVTCFSASISGSLSSSVKDNLSKSVWFLISNTASTVETIKNSGQTLKASLNDDGSFYCIAGDLSSNTSYYYLACAKVGDTEFYGQVQSFKTAAVNATATTKPATEVGLSAATMNGTLSVNNDDIPSAPVVTFLYSSTASTLEALKQSGTSVKSTKKSGGFSYSLTSLSTNTTYYYVVRGQVYDQSFYGQVQSFKTMSYDDIRITTNDASSVGLFTAKVSGSLNVKGPDNAVKSVWFYYADRASTLEALKTSGSSTSATFNADGSFSSNLSNLTWNKDYYFVACAQLSDNREIAAEVRHFKTQTRTVPQGGVEMGLSVIWASCNVGASTPGDYGDYFAWGELEAKSNYSWETYKYCRGTSKTLTKYNTNSIYGTVDSKTTLESFDDVAHVRLGGNWRMPTEAEMLELINTRTNYAYYSWTWTQKDGHNGWLVSHKPTGNNIFLPAAGRRYDTSLYTVGSSGYYWSSSLNTYDPVYAYFLYFGSGYVRRDDEYYRYYGLSVRPVSE